MDGYFQYIVMVYIYIYKFNQCEHKIKYDLLLEEFTYI